MHFLKGLSAFKPTKFNGCALWLAADRGVTTVDGKVSAWADQSGNGNHAAQSTVDSRPLYVESAQGGRPTLRFDGSNDKLTGTAPLSGTTPFTMFVVAQDRAGTDPWRGAVSFGYNSPTAGYCLCARYAAAPLFGAAWGGSSTGISYTSTEVPTYAIIQSARYTGTTNQSWVNGSAGNIVSKSDSSLSTDNYVIGILFGIESVCKWKGDISEIIVFNRALTDAERVKVEQYLSGKYAITLS